MWEAVMVIALIVLAFLAGYSIDNTRRLKALDRCCVLLKENRRLYTENSLLQGRSKFTSNVLADKSLTYFQQVEKIKKLYIPDFNQTDK